VLRWLSKLRRHAPADAATDRRREERRNLKLPIEVRTAAGVTYKGFSRDLSSSGMGAVVSAPLNAGDEIWVKYSHPVPGSPTGLVMARRAKVRQSRGYRYGFEFDFSVPLQV